MKIAFGLKAHSGWAALIVLGVADGELEVIERRRIELVEEMWAKQPYHAAEELEIKTARALVERGVRSAHSIALREMRKTVKRSTGAGHKVAACAVLVGSPMPEWSVDEILAVHFRMHKAEGVLFRDALARAARTCELEVVEIPEKELEPYAQQILGAAYKSLLGKITSLGKSIGPPWGKDQKDATLAALIALKAG